AEVAGVEEVAEPLRDVVGVGLGVVGMPLDRLGLRDRAEDLPEELHVALLLGELEGAVVQLLRREVVELLDRRHRVTFSGSRRPSCSSQRANTRLALWPPNPNPFESA